MEAVFSPAVYGRFCRVALAFCLSLVHNLYKRSSVVLAGAGEKGEARLLLVSKLGDLPAVITN